MSYQTIAGHACELVRSAEIRPDPFPHIVVDGIFPEQYYEELLSNLPPVSSLSIPVAFGMMKIGEDDATFQSMPESARQFWIEFDQKVKPSICEALLERYLLYAAEKLSLIFGEEAEHLKSQLEPKEFRSVRGIVQCRITGARMGAHVDKATSLFTYLFYFAPDDSLRPFGTIFYKAQDRASLLERYRANCGIRAWFPEAGELDLRPQPPLEFGRNRLVSYVNLPYSLHGAATDAGTSVLHAEFLRLATSHRVAAL